MPAFGKVRDAVVLIEFPMFPPGGAVPVNDTLCSLALVNVHVTVPPGAIVTVDGVKVSLAVAVTSAVDGLGPLEVTVTVTSGDGTVSDVALICDVPAATPVAVTDAPVVAERETFDWSDVVQVTVRDKGVP